MTLTKCLRTLEYPKAVTPNVVERIQRIFYVEGVYAVPFVTVYVHAPGTDAHPHAPGIKDTPVHKEPLSLSTASLNLARFSKICIHKDEKKGKGF